MSSGVGLRRSVVRGLGVVGLAVAAVGGVAAHWLNLSFGHAAVLSGAASITAFAAFAGLSLLLVFWRGAGRRLVGAHLGLLVLLVAESVATGAQIVSSLAASGHHTPRHTSPMQGHPFLHVSTGLGMELNSAGFPGREMHYDKPAGVVRVACIGGSTTALGYPAVLERALNAAGDGSRYEVYNFGMFAWTSTHSVVNFVINVVDYQPDIVVIHHAINDLALMQEEGCCRDYTHALAPVVRQSPSLAAAALGESALGRLARSWLTPPPESGSDFPEGTAPCPAERSCGALAKSPLERNIESMVKLARSYGMVPVLTTQPIQADWGAGQLPEEDRYWRAAPEVNQSIRELAARVSDDAIFVDLDALMTRPAWQHFTDMCHLDEQGKRIKAHHLAAAIRSSRQASGANPFRWREVHARTPDRRPQGCTHRTETGREPAPWIPSRWRTGPRGAPCHGVAESGAGHSGGPLHATGRHPRAAAALGGTTTHTPHHRSRCELPLRTRARDGEDSRRLSEPAWAGLWPLERPGVSGRRGSRSGCCRAVGSRRPAPRW